jgi:hypothetical protein
METMYFTIGVASALVVAIATAAVWATTKVIQLRLQVNNLLVEMIRQQEELYRNSEDLDTRINNRLDQAITDARLEVEDTRRYIDSRVDKLLQQVYNNPNLGLNTDNKQLIKG